MKYQNQFLYVFTGIIVSNTKSNAQDNLPILGLSDSNYLRGSGLTLAKETGKREESIEQNKKRVLEVATTKLVSAFSKALGDDCCGDDVGDDPTSPTSPTSTPPPQPDETFYSCKDEGTLLSNTHMKENGQMQSEDPIGCFEDYDSVDSKTFSDMSNIVQDCSQYCSTDFFGLVGATCKCFFDTPPKRLSISSCCDVQYDGVRMDVYFKSIIEDGCNQDITRNLRDQLVQENNADLGYDIVKNTYLSSPFKFYNKGCGTNIYDLKTDVSGNSGSMTTVSNVLSEYAKGIRLHVSQSIGASVSAGLFKKASAKASASFDYEINSAFQSSGAKEIGSKRFSSFGVKRLSEIDLVNFDNKKYFATFNDDFIEALRRYIEYGYAKVVAKDIFDSYGMVVLEYGVVGGYVQISSTAASSDLSKYFSSETDMNVCYETAVSGSADFKVASGSFSAEESGCSGIALSFMQAKQQQFSAEASETNYVGGEIKDGEFNVTPETAKLLTNADMYVGDGMRLRLITDFLQPDKVSPLEIKRHLLTEAQFEEAQQHLQDHALEILEEIGGFLDDCLPCAGVPYLELQSGTDDFTCDCYEPLYPENKFVASDGTAGDTFGGYCAAKDDLIVVGSTQAPPAGAAYLFRADGTQLAKLTPGADGGPETHFGWYVAIDEKIVVSATDGIIGVFDLDGNHERTLTCNTCDDSGKAFGAAKTSGDKIVARGKEGGTYKLFVYSTSGSLLKKIGAGSSSGVIGMSDQYIASLTWESGKVAIYVNSSPDFPLRTEISVPTTTRGVAVAGDKLVIGDRHGFGEKGAAYLYTVDGTKIADLDRQDSTSGSRFGTRVDITDEYIVVGAYLDDIGGNNAGAVYVYSSIDGSFVEKRLVGANGDQLGVGVCAYGPYYFAGAPYDDTMGTDSGAGYIFSFP